MGDIKLLRVAVNGTTDQYGMLQVPNTSGSTNMVLLRNTYNDNVGASFGVVNLEGYNSSMLSFRFRTLKDGSVNANVRVNFELVMASFG